MPVYEYLCGSCGHGFEALVFGSERPECPECGGERLEKKLSAFATRASGTTETMPLPGGCGTCGDPRGPGACSS